MGGMYCDTKRPNQSFNQVETPTGPSLALHLLSTSDMDVPSTMFLKNL